jgi:hypothetical protein
MVLLRTGTKLEFSPFLPAPEKNAKLRITALPLLECLPVSGTTGGVPKKGHSRKMFFDRFDTNIEKNAIFTCPRPGVPKSLGAWGPEPPWVLKKKEPEPKLVDILPLKKCQTSI